MTRRFAPAAVLLLFGGVLLAQPPKPADPPKPPAVPADAPDAPKATTDLRKPQEQNAKLFKELSLGLLRLAQKLEKSDRPEDVERAKTIRSALKVAEETGVETQFQKLIGGLGKGTNRLPELEQLAGQDAELAKALQQIVEILMTDDETARIKAEIARLTEMLKEVKDIKRREEIIRAMTEAQKGDATKIAKTQADLARQTKDLMDRMAGKKPGDPKAGEPKPSEPPMEPAEPKADPKDGDKPGEQKPTDGKPSDPKDGKGKPSEGSPADAKPNPGPPKPGQPSQGNGQPKPPGPPKPPGDSSAQSPPPPQNQTPGRKQVQEAYPQMEQAKKDLEKNDRQEASKKESKAIEELQKAIDELEKRLRQLREEEMLKTLAAIEARCNRMLAMQIDVFENTKAIHAAVVKNGNMKTTADVQKSQQQSGKEGEIVAEADRAMKLLEAEGSAVAFAKVLEEVRGDMVAVQKRLDAAYVDTDTQGIEENIIAMLKDMIAALKKAQQDIEAGKNPPPGGPPPRNQNQLIDILSELRLIRAMQVQVNGRTAMYGKKSPGEQASDPIIRDELKQLAGRQTRLQDMIQKIATKMNQ